jgi:hypothetical protein
MTEAVRIACLAAIATVCLTISALAQTSATWTGPTSGLVPDGIYMTPYYATVGDAANRPVVSGDFGDDSHFNSTWNATVTSFSSITPGNTAWGLAGANRLLYTAENGGHTTRGLFNSTGLSPEVTGTLSVCKAEHGCAAQKFVTVPEGGSTLAYLLVAGLCCAAAMLLRSRRVVTGTIA